MGIRHLVCAGLALVLAVPVIRADDDDSGKEPKIWTVDFAKAKEKASEEKLDILMEFTGSDWCPPCIALHNKVLTKKEFKETAPKHFVLLKLDSPRDKSKQSDEEQAQYKELSKKFKVTGVPTIILADAEGRPYAKMVGYGGQEAEKYVANLVEKTSARKERDEHFAAAKKAKGEERAKLLAKGLENLDEDLVVSTYRDTVDEIIELDANDKAKLKSKFTALIEATEVKAALQEIQRSARAKPEAALESLEKLIGEKQLKGELLQEAYFAKGAILFRTDKAASKSALQEAIKAAPDSELGERISGIIERSFKDETKDDDNDKKDKEDKKDDN